MSYVTRRLNFIYEHMPDVIDYVEAHENLNMRGNQIEVIKHGVVCRKFGISTLSATKDWRKAIDQVIAMTEPKKKYKLKNKTLQYS